MIKLAYLITFILLLTAGSVYSQTISIKGEWTCYKVEDEEGTTGEEYSFYGKPYNHNYKLVIIENDSLDYYNGAETVKVFYKYNGDSLLIWNIKYKVVSLTDDELIIFESVNDQKGLGKALRFKYFYKRI